MPEWLQTVINGVRFCSYWMRCEAISNGTLKLLQAARWTKHKAPVSHQEAA
ncbi:hypothetical protein KCP70_03370 [Salmonella enterica subsp. enterica]|nr:hypothetical protein KCP70_03370 [Salmonella enterica subsp. enterica]